MKNRFCMLTLAAGVFLCAFGGIQAKAAPVLVYEDDLTFSYTLTVTGAGKATLTFTNVSLVDVNVTTAFAPVIASSLGDLPFKYTGPTVASAPFFTSVTSADTTKTMGPSGGSSAILTYNVTVGAGQSLVSDGFLNLKGTVTGISAPSHTIVVGGVTYDWSPFASGLGTVNLTMTSGSNIAALLAAGVAGTSAQGTGGMQEQVAAVPEPASLALLGIGMTGFLAFRRLLKRSKLA